MIFLVILALIGSLFVGILGWIYAEKEQDPVTSFDISEDDYKNC